MNTLPLGQQFDARSRAVKIKIVCDSLPAIHERVRWFRMFAARLIVPETGEARVKPEFALVELLFSKSEHEKTDAEAVQDWESEGGASTHLHEEAFAEAVTRLTSNRKSP